MKISGFELPLVACCGCGGMYNYRSSVGCGGTITFNGSQICVGSCEGPLVRVNWDGIHRTDAADKLFFYQISTGAFSNPSILLKMACHNSRFVGTQININENNVVLRVIVYSLILSS